MLAPLIFDSLTVALLFLLIGWASDAFRASMHDGPGDPNTERTWNENRLSPPRQPRPAADPDATWTTRPARQNLLPERRPRTSRGFQPEPAGTGAYSGLRSLWTGEETNRRAASWCS
jgi:hypothetical protein